jgi:hypothetical protein
MGADVSLPPMRGCPSATPARSPTACAIAELPGKGNGKANLTAFDVHQRVDV